MPIFIGTAGYVYPHWKRAFYPPGLPATSQLSHYLSHYQAVEINATFHAFPRQKTLSSWCAKAHQTTLFALKAPGQITHTKRLQNVTDDISSFLETTASALGPHLGPILFQCPPSLHYSLPLLEDLLFQLSQARETSPAPNLRFALEFRSSDWFRTEVYALLAVHNIALVNNIVVRDDDFYTVDDAALPHCRGLDIPRAGWAYNRFHGSKVPGVKTNFPDSVLRRFARGAVTRMKESSTFVEFSFFLNDLDAIAPVSARRYAQIVAEETGTRVPQLLGGFVPAYCKKKASIATFFKTRADKGKDVGASNGAAKPLGGFAGRSKESVPIQTASKAKIAPKRTIVKPASSSVRRAVSKAHGKDITSYFRRSGDHG